MVFKRNKKYFSSLTEVKEGYFLSEQPLFLCGKQGLFPVFKTGGPTGRFPKNHQEFVLKEVPKEVFDGYNHKTKPNKTTKNILEFEEEDTNELLKRL
jgi:hypothetical protein